jgi:thiol-disulfide isomerase/thioredoxin
MSQYCINAYLFGRLMLVFGCLNLVLACAELKAALQKPTAEPKLQSLSNAPTSLPVASVLQKMRPQTLERQAVDVAKYANKVVVLDVWATWCDSCVEALPVWEKLAKEHPEIAVVALSVDASRSDVLGFWNAQGGSIELWWDPNSDIAETLLKVNSIPTTFVFGRDGSILTQEVGLTDTGVKRVIDVALAAVAPPQSL